MQSVENGVATIGFPETFAPQMELANTKDINQTLIESLGKAGHAVERVQHVVAERPADWAPLNLQTGSGTPDDAADGASDISKPPKGPIDIEEFKNDPLIKQALEVFKGQIVDVRN